MFSLIPAPILSLNAVGGQKQRTFLFNHLLEFQKVGQHALEKQFQEDVIPSKYLQHSCPLLSSPRLPSQGPKRRAQPGREERSLGGTDLGLLVWVFESWGWSPLAGVRAGLSDGAHLLESPLGMSPKPGDRECGCDSSTSTCWLCVSRQSSVPLWALAQ